MGDGVLRSREAEVGSAPVPRLRFVLELASARTPVDIARALHADGLGWLGVDGLALHRLSVDGRGLELVRPASDVRERMPAAVWIPIAGPGPVCQAVRTGESTRAAGRAFLPLRGDRGVIGVLTLSLRLGVEDEDRRALADVVETCQRALERTIHDEAERVARAAAEARAARLAEELALRDRSLAMVVHDLRNPLSAIVMSARLLAEEPRSARNLARIGRSAERMQRMIDQLLDVAKLRQGEPLAIDRRPCELGAVVDDAIDEARLAFPRARIAVERGELGAGEGAFDAIRVGQVISNLIANAIEHGAADAPVEVRARGDAHAVTIEVANQGAAIDADTLPAIFQPFQRGARAPTERRRRGSLGLGLYITRALVEAHGGTIEVTSGARETCFRVTLPRG